MVLSPEAVEYMTEQELLTRLEKLIDWGESEIKSNNVFRKSSYDVNDEWIDKVRELHADVFAYGREKETPPKKKLRGEIKNEPEALLEHRRAV